LTKDLPAAVEFNRRFAAALFLDVLKIRIDEGNLSK